LQIANIKFEQIDIDGLGAGELQAMFAAGTESAGVAKKQEEEKKEAKPSSDAEKQDEEKEQYISLEDLKRRYGFIDGGQDGEKLVNEYDKEDQLAISDTEDDGILTETWVKTARDTH